MSNARIRYGHGPFSMGSPMWPGVELGEEEGGTEAAHYLNEGHCTGGEGEGSSSRDVCDLPEYLFDQAESSTASTTPAFQCAKGKCQP